MELAKLWRTDKFLRRLDVSAPNRMYLELRLRHVYMGRCDPDTYFNLCLQAVMVVADRKQSLTITGNGDVLEPNDGIIGSAALSDWSYENHDRGSYFVGLCIVGAKTG